MAKGKKSAKKETLVEETKEEVVEKVKDEPKVLRTTRVWDGVGWAIVDENHPDYKPGKQDQS